MTIFLLFQFLKRSFSIIFEKNAHEKMDAAGCYGDFRILGIRTDQ